METSSHPRRSARIAAYSPNKPSFASNGQRTVSANRAGSARKKHASPAGSQSDTGSSGHSSSSSGSSGSSVWDSLEDFKESKEQPTGPLPQFQELNKGLIALAHALTEKPDDLAHLEDIVNRMYWSIVRVIIRPGYAPYWPEFQLWVDVGKRLSKAAMDKRTAAAQDADIARAVDQTLAQLGLRRGSWVPLKAGDFDNSWMVETATPEYIQELYRNAAPPVEFDWDGVDGQGGVYSPEDDDPLVIHPVFRYSTPPPTF